MFVSSYHHFKSYDIIYTSACIYIHIHHESNHQPTYKSTYLSDGQHFCAIMQQLNVMKYCSQDIPMLIMFHIIFIHLHPRFGIRNLQENFTLPLEPQNWQPFVETNLPNPDSAYIFLPSPGQDPKLATCTKDKLQESPIFYGKIDGVHCPEI